MAVQHDGNLARVRTGGWDKIMQVQVDLVASSHSRSYVGCVRCVQSKRVVAVVVESWLVALDELVSLLLGRFLVRRVLEHVLLRTCERKVELVLWWNVVLV